MSTASLRSRLLLSFGSLLSWSLLPWSPLPAQEPTPPTPVATKPAPKPTEPPVYDEAADARKEVAAALLRAKKENRRVLIQWGANWCGWCRWLAGTMRTNAEVSKKLSYEYDVVHVDVGRFDKHMDLAKELGAEFKAIPFLTILGSDGKAVVQQNTEPFETKVDGKNGHDPKKLLAFLTEHQAPYLDAAALRQAAIAKAKADDKMVFLHFGAPWCGWCHRLEDWMARPEIAAVLGREFLDLKIDTERTVGGEAMMQQELEAAGLGGQGIPWFVFLDGDGKVVAHSTGPKGNVGFPYQPYEVEHFGAMLNKAKRHLSDADIATLVQSLHDVREADAKKKAEKPADR